MKRIIYLVASAMATCAALASCNKLNSSAEEPAAPKTHTVSFAAAQSDTRTSMTIEDGYAYFSWEEADADSIYVYENDTPGVVSAHLEGDRMMISATFPGDAPASATYYAHVNSWNDMQFPQPGSYDGSADVLVAEPITAIPEDDDILPLVFHREVAINKITIKGLGSGETVSGVQLLTDKWITGTYCKNKWALSTPEVTMPELDIYPYESEREEQVVVDEDGNAVVYFTCLPADDVNIEIVVTTGTLYERDRYYSKVFARPISFAKGAVKSFSVTVEPEPLPEPMLVAVENFNSKQGNVLDYYSSNSNPFRNSDTFKFDYVWTVSSDSSAVTRFKNGIVLGSDNKAGKISCSTILSEVQGSYIVRVYAASLFKPIDDEEEPCQLYVHFYNEDMDEMDLKGLEVINIITDLNQTYSESHFASYTDFEFSSFPGEYISLSVNPGTRIIIDKIEILYYESDDEGGDIEGGDGEDITVDDPEG